MIDDDYELAVATQRGVGAMHSMHSYSWTYVCMHVCMCVCICI